MGCLGNTTGIYLVLIAIVLVFLVLVSQLGIWLFRRFVSHAKKPTRIHKILWVALLSSLLGLVVGYYVSLPFATNCGCQCDYSYISIPVALVIGLVGTLFFTSRKE